MDRSEQPAAPLPPDLAPEATVPRRRKTRAQATVEFALISPLLFILALGIMEFGWLFRSYMTVNFATREGARAGALMGSMAQPDQQILRAITDTMVGMSFPDVLEVSIYNSDTRGDCITVGPNCQENAYRPGTVDPWEPIFNRTNNWPPTSRHDDEPTDALGVRMKYRHVFLINFLPGATGEMVIDDRSIMKIEPRSFPTPTPR